MAMYRIRPGMAAALRHPDHGGYVTPSLSETFDENDPLVRAFPDHFATDADLERERPVEQATARPGEKRQTRR